MPADSETKSPLALRGPHSIAQGEGFRSPGIAGRINIPQKPCKGDTMASRCHAHGSGGHAFAVRAAFACKLEAAGMSRHPNYDIPFKSRHFARDRA
jgi:hypothetical protein